MACPSIAPGGPFLSGLLDHIDCQAQSIGQAGYQALAAPGSTVGLLLSVMLTIFVALFGYRMLLGQVPDLRDGVLAVVKIGLVLVLATSWPAFRTLAYDVAMRGPAELSTAIGAPAGLPGAGGGLVPRLQRIDSALIELVQLGTGRPDISDQIAGPSATPQTQQQAAAELERLQRAARRPAWDPQRDAALVAQGRTLYLTGAIAAFAIVRIVAGLLLALGPLFALFLLFDATRGLFEGWVRGLAGAALGAVATSIVLGIELALLEPWLAQVLDARRNDISTPSVPTELLVIGLVFLITLIATLIAVAKVAHGFRIPDAVRTASTRAISAMRGAATERPLAIVAGETPGPASRAHRIADAVAATQRRERAAEMAALPDRATAPNRSIGAAMRSSGGTVVSDPPLGQRAHRRNASRTPARAARRDRTT